MEGERVERGKERERGRYGESDRGERRKRQELSVKRQRKRVIGRYGERGEMGKR